MHIISIDPGRDTAIVCGEWSGCFGDDLVVVDYEQFRLDQPTVAGKIARITSCLRRVNMQADFGIIERPFAHRDNKGQVNVNSFATQIENLTCIKAAFESIFADIDRPELLEVWPSTWQSAILRAGKGETGERSIELCRQHTGLRVSDHVADAYNIGLWAVACAKIKQSVQLHAGLGLDVPARNAAQTYQAVRMALTVGNRVGDLW